MNIGEVWRLNSGGPWMTITGKAHNTVYFQYFDEMQRQQAFQFYYGDSAQKFFTCFTKKTTLDDLRKAGSLGVDTQGKAGYCERNEGCVCGGDLPRVREGCANWVTLPTTEPRR